MSVHISRNQRRFHGRVSPHVHHLLRIPMRHIQTEGWQFQRHAWRQTSAEWSSAPTEPLWKCSRSVVCLISHLLLIHHPFCTSGMLAGTKHMPLVPRQGQWREQNLCQRQPERGECVDPLQARDNKYSQQQHSVHGDRCQSRVTVWKVSIRLCNTI